MTTMWQDIRYSLRMLGRSPGFALVVVVILALGIGANTAVFSVVNAVMLRPLPYREPGRLVNLYQQWKGGAETNISPTQFAYWRQHNEVFEQIAGTSYRPVYLSEVDRPRQIQAKMVSADYFSLLGFQPILGRVFRADEEKSGSQPVVVLGYAFWQDEWGGDPNVIGKSLVLDGESHAIIGVMDREFESGMPFLLPLVLEKCYGVMSMARLKKDVTLAQARANMTLVSRQLEEVDPKHAGGYTATVHRYLDDYFGNHRRTLLLLLGSAAFVLLIACSNVANLLLARATLRQQEIGVRLAVGASRNRIVRQVLTESILLSIAGGLLGLLVTQWGVKGLVGFCPIYIPRLWQTRVDVTVLAFTLGISMVTGLLFGLLPAWKMTEVRLGQVLKEGQTRSSTSRGWRRLRNGLLVSQITIALMLLMGAALLIRSLMALHRTDLGFETRNVLVMDVDLPQMKYPQPQQQKAFFDQLLENVRAMPGVRSAALVPVQVSLGGGGSATHISIGVSATSPEERFEVMGRRVGRGFFETMGMRIVRGRSFTEEDVRAEIAAPGQNLIIDEMLARQRFADADPIGQCIYYDEQCSGTVVGIVSTLKDYQELTPPHGVLYELLSQWYFHSMNIVIKTEGEPMRLADALRAQVHALDEDQTCELWTLEDELANMLRPRRFAMVLLGVYAVVALIIACAGLYSLLQYMVANQAHEIGIRMALGATQERIVWTVLRQGGLLIATGIGLGLLGGYAMSRIVASLLYETKPTDPAVLAIVLVTLLGTAFAACYVPARRAAKVDPMAALRCE